MAPADPGAGAPERPPAQRAARPRLLAAPGGLEPTACRSEGNGVLERDRLHSDRFAVCLHTDTIGRFRLAGTANAPSTRWLHRMPPDLGSRTALSRSAAWDGAAMSHVISTPMGPRKPGHTARRQAVAVYGPAGRVPG